LEVQVDALDEFMLRAILLNIFSSRSNHEPCLGTNSWLMSDFYLKPGNNDD
jgi:hypothetical protein